MPASPRVALIALCLAACLSTAARGAELLGRTLWSDPNPAFGGLSGIAVSPDGTRMFAVGDKGILVEARMLRAPDATLQSIETVAIQPFTETADRLYPDFLTDAEGIDWVGDDRLVISYEGYHRVEEVSTEGRLIRRLPMPKFFKQFQNNSSLESVAVDARGRVFTALERSGQLDRPFPVYLLQGGTWTVAFELPRRDDFLLVGMDFGPDGRLYTLERALRSVFFASRVRAITLDADLRITDDTTILETTTGTHNNLEGISVWRDGAGRLRMSLLADDNFNIFFSTEIVEYLIDQG